MSKVLFEKTGRIGRITLNRPEVMNAIDDELPALLSEAVGRADTDPDIHVIILCGSGSAFCSGYDLKFYAEGKQRTLENRLREAITSGVERATS